MERSDETRKRADDAFARMLSLTNSVRSTLIKRSVRNALASE